MDRTSRIGLAVCLGLFIFLLISTPPPKPAPASVPAPATSSAPTPAPVMTAATTGAPAAPGTNPASTQAPSAPIAEQLAALENDAIKVTFTSLGAAIKEIELKQYTEDKFGTVVLNERARENVMQLSGWPGADAVTFQTKENQPSGITYTGELPGGVKWERTYTLGHEQDLETGMGANLKAVFQWLSKALGHEDKTKPAIYNLDVSDTLTNAGTSDITLPSYSLSVGRAEPLRVTGHYQPGPYQYPASGWLANKFHLVTVNDFNPSSFLGAVKTREPRVVFSSKEQEEGPLKWLSVENQFFAVLLTPTEDHPIQHAEFQCFNQRDANGYVFQRYVDGFIQPNDEPDIEAAGYFPEVKIPAGQSVILNYGLYAGPKEYDRLDALGGQQEELMYYGMFSLLIVPMLFVLHVWYSIFGNYGVAIILLTVVIKIITWPLQSFTNRSGKRMQALAPKLKEVQAKFKDQPEKITAETMSLYREYGVNPFAGCLPALIQMPVFFSLYFMLQNAVELRGQPFLWVHDLTQPDTVFSCTLPFALFGLSHLALNPLPIMVTGLTMVMMRLTPQIGDPQQAKIAQFMPLVFLFIFYNFAAALSLYYVINNCVSIVQIYRNVRKPLPELKRIPRKKAA